VLADARIQYAAGVRSDFERGGSRAVLAVPLMVQERVIGALAVRDERGRVFGDDEIRLAQTFGDLSSLVLENSRLFSCGKRRRAHAEIRAEVERELLAERAPDRLLALIVERAAALFTATGVISLSRADDMLIPKAIAGAGGFSDFAVPFGTGVVGRCAATRQSLIGNDYSTWPDAVPRLVALGVVHAVA